MLNKYADSDSDSDADNVFTIKWKRFGISGY